MPKDEVFDLAWLEKQLRDLPVTGRWVVAYSGGGDSQALLHALKNGGAGDRPLIAVHINHGMQTMAAQWSEFCADNCKKWDIPFELIHIDVCPHKNESPEACAREQRYAALRSIMRKGDGLLTAHHADDQAETLLIQLLRGSGPAGLAAMPRIVPYGDGWHVRPLLPLKRIALRNYLEHINLDWIEDPSNRSQAPTRNYLRHNVLPILEKRWPSVVKTLGRVANQQAETQALLSYLGRQDLELVTSDNPGVLLVSKLRTLPKARLHNAVRVWISGKGLPLPSSRRLSSLKQILEARSDSQAELCWQGAELRRYRDELFIDRPLEPHDPTQIIEWDPRYPLSVASLNILLNSTDLHSDVRSLKLSGTRLTIRFRKGGERCKTSPYGPNRKLKSLFQDAGVPPWRRDRIPLLYADEDLIEVIGYWVCH